ncbi:MAG TPA: CHASE3 domain-containing protein [Gaiellaceae bacterium]|nr:CHASE3 domain-containing protein [Gaiellaceae bacterium]
MLASALLTLVVGAAFAVLLVAVADLRDASRAARHSEEVLAAVNELERLVVDLETGVRGFVITGEERFLEPWEAARAAVPARAAALQELVAGNGQQASRARRLGEEANSYVEEYAVPLVDAVRREDPSARSVGATAEGKRRVDAMRLEFDRFVGAERALASAREERADSAARRAIIAAVGGLGGSILLVLLFAGYLTQAIVRPVRRAAAMAGRLAEGALGTRMPENGVGEIGALERSFNVMASSLERNRDQLAELAAEQAALRRVATLVARATSPVDIFSAVAEELAHRLGADITKVLRYEPDGTATVVGGWSVPGLHIPIGTRPTVEGEGVAVSVLRTGRPARTDRFEGPPGSVSACFRQLGVHSGVGSPIVVERRLWGVAIAASSQPEPLPVGSEDRVADFTELLATAIANAESRAELAASRARVVAAGDETRRRLERDLHDGAQQRLVSLALNLRAAASEIPPDQQQVQDELARVGSGLEGVLDDLREISRGIHPAILSEGGLAPALRTLARRSSVPVVLDLATEPRLPERIEVAAYYVVSEALANAAKHASASAVHVDVHATDGALRLSIRDDGRGGADPARGSGLIGLKDRVEATGGAMVVESPVGAGTSLFVELPLDDGQPRNAAAPSS